MKINIFCTILPVSIIFFFVFLCMKPSNSKENIDPPVAKIIPKKLELHSDIRIDNYFWLREKTNPEVIEYIKAENKYTELIMKKTEKLQEKLYNEFLGRIKEDDSSVPEKIDNYYYYKRTEKGKQYSIYCRKKGSLDAKEEILLDVNEIAKGHDYISIGVFEISPNHKMLAYSTDIDGSETYTIYIKDLETGRLLTDKIENTYYSLEWANDNKVFFYTVLDNSRRPYKVYKHILGTDSKDDSLVYHEKDEAFNIWLSKTKDKKYIIMNILSNTTTEIHYMEAETSNGSFKVFYPREQNIEYNIEHHADKFFILTNENAKDFKLVSVPDKDISKENWKEIIPHRISVKLDDIDVFKNHLVVYEREKALKKIRIINLNNNETHYVDFPEPVYTFWSSGNRDFNSNVVRFTYTSLITSKSVFDYDMDKKTRELKKQYEVLGGYKPELYQSERVFAKASDDTLIPISLVYKKGITKNGNNPLFLYAYGSYGACTEPDFDSNRISLLDRGFIYAIAHVRGGEEMGREWYENGKLLNKKNTFTDFIACAEYLINEKYTSKDKLVINGGSAGGLLMGAVTNLRPDLFKVVIAEVPFVDVLNTMLDPSLPLTVIEYEEWGNPNDKKYYDYIKSYSPYDNIKAQDYPNILITAGLNDPRVSYWEPLKFVAKLRALKTDKNILLIKTDMGSGHSGPSGRYSELKEIAFIYSFIFDILEIKE